MKKRTIGIVTLVGYSNYGNRLQNYALKKVLEQLELDVTSLVVDQPTSKKTLFSLYKLRFFNMLKNPIKKIRDVLFRKEENRTSNANKKRTEYFKKFSNQYLNEYTLNTTDSNHKKFIEELSYIIVGSDQVWNPGNFILGDKYFLTFTDTNKRLSYAASFGVEEIPKHFKSRYKYWLENMNYISVREDAGENIVKKLVNNKEVSVHVDPTMLLTKKEWLEIAVKAQNRPDSKYILTYFLGDIDKIVRNKIEEIAKEMNMIIINLGDKTEIETYETGPSEFLDYINNASLFFTDSFHGIVFSIIFKTPFLVFERDTQGLSMYSRIETLLDSFNFKDREWKDFSGDVFNMDFSHTEKILNREYIKSINYLKKATNSEARE